MSHLIKLVQSVWEKRKEQTKKERIQEIEQQTSIEGLRGITFLCSSKKGNLTKHHPDVLRAYIRKLLELLPQIKDHKSAQYFHSTLHGMCEFDDDFYHIFELQEIRDTFKKEDIQKLKEAFEKSENIIKSKKGGSELWYLTPPKKSRKRHLRRVGTVIR
jgi:hypothetical protein